MATMMTQGELDVMGVLWDHGELKPAEIQQHFPRPINNAALRFQLRTLLEKGHVVRRKVGKAYFYKARTQRQRTFWSMARHMANAFTKGSTAGLVAELLKTEKFSRQEIEELQQIAARKGSGKTSKQ